MLSILIPVYNYDIRKLIEQLIFQLENEKILYEIIVIDDFSQDFKEVNSLFLRKFSNITYIELPYNIGRAKIRNLLAEKAKYENIIFLDCDILLNRNFIKNYISNLDKNIICGGRDYLKQKPQSEYVLHWKYGVYREIKAQKQKHFFSSNFLIKKQIFERIKFDETISGYGHEDTIFALDLKNNGYDITFIDNPVYHIGLDINQKFIEKTKHWISNSNFLVEKYGNKIISEIKLFRFYHLLESLKLRFLLKLCYSFFNKIIEKNLLSKNPKIFLLDIYKLLFLAKISKQKLK